MIPCAFLPVSPCIGRFPPGVVVGRPSSRGCVSRARVTCAAGGGGGDRAVWADAVCKRHGRELFTDVSFSLGVGAKVALMGANGSGKSTLLAILAGLQQPDKGSTAVRKGLSVAYVGQELPNWLELRQSARAAVLQLAGKWTNSETVKVALKYEKVMGEMAEVEEKGGDLGKVMQKVEKVVGEMEERDGCWDVGAWLERGLGRLEIDGGKMVRDMSGGERRRVGICGALVGRTDVMLLDEVTNHMSVEGMLFLEEVLGEVGVSVLCISHDRWFVDRVFKDGIWELRDGKLNMFGGGYENFLSEKAKGLEIEEREMGVLKKAVKKELEWVRKMPKGRGSKSKARVEKFEVMDGELKVRKRKKLESGGVRELVSGTSRLGSEVVDMKNVTIRRGDRTVVENFNYCFERGERVGLCGGNGIGKSSLMKAIMGDVKIESGEIVVGDTVVFGYFEQEGIDVSLPLSEASSLVLGGGKKKKGNMDEIRVVDYVGEMMGMYGHGKGGGGGGGGGGARVIEGESDEDRVEAMLDKKIEMLSYSVAVGDGGGSSRGDRNGGGNTGNGLGGMNAVGLLEHFGFRRDQQHSFVSRLSGGEKRRLQLMGLLLKNPNFLLLDEVSNDLDVEILTTLEDLLLEYNGVLVLCSHDRYMLDRLVDHLIVLEGNGEYRLVEGRFTEYLEAKREEENEEKRKMKKANLKKKKGVDQEKEKKPSLSYKERKEYENLQGDIDKCEKLYNNISAKLSSEAETASYNQLADWGSQLATLEMEISVKTERWLTLAELVDII